MVDRAGYLRWRPVEADTPLHRDHWFWHPHDEATLKSVSELVDTYNKTVGRGAQLMIGIAPDDTGKLPAADAARLHEFGDAIRRIYGTNLVKDHNPNTGGDAALDNDPDTFWTTPAGSHHAMLEVDFPHPITFDRALTMERLNEGQSVQQYAIEFFDHGAWKRLAGAQAIGHKKIDIFPAVTAQRVRLNLISTVREASIREFQLYNGSAAK